MNAWYNEQRDTTAVSCCEKFIVKSPCATLQKPLQYTRVHTNYNSLYGLQQPIRFTIQVYGLHFELKAKRQAGLSKSKHSKALAKQQLT